MNYVKHVNFGVFPKEIKMTETKKGPCPHCDGTGSEPEKAEKCTECGGQGWIEVYTVLGGVQ